MPKTDDGLCRLSERERKVLIWMVESGEGVGWGFPFKTIASWGIIPEKAVRRTVRALARKGLAELLIGLFDDDGRINGSGYGVTEKGIARYKAMEGEPGVH